MTPARRPKRALSTVFGLSTYGIAIDPIPRRGMPTYALDGSTLAYHETRGARSASIVFRAPTNAKYLEPLFSARVKCNASKGCEIARLPAALIAQARNFLSLSRNFLLILIRVLLETSSCCPVTTRRTRHRIAHEVITKHRDNVQLNRVNFVGIRPTHLVAHC